MIDLLWEFWCCRGGLSSRPRPYQGRALPLSYGSEGDIGVAYISEISSRGDQAGAGSGWARFASMFRIPSGLIRSWPRTKGRPS